MLAGHGLVESTEPATNVFHLTFFANIHSRLIV